LSGRAVFVFGGKAWATATVRASADPSGQYMIDDPKFRPDITLTIDGGGVIRNAVSAEALAGEPMEQWRGLRWVDTVPSDTARQVARAVEGAQREGDSSCFTVKQRLPSGRELLLEYTTVKLGGKSGLIAIGKNLEAISELRSRLALVQQEREQDYWKLREIETRYRALLDASSGAVALVRVANLRVVEANVAATKLLGLVPGGEFLPRLADQDRRNLEATLDTARLNGRAPSIALHLLNDGPWSLRTSMQANHTFLDLVQAGVESAVIGQNLKRWLSQPGTGIRVIMSLVERHGAVRAMRTTLDGELGAATEVEISAVGDRLGQASYYGLVIRDVASRSRESEEAFSVTALLERSPDAPLESLIRSSTEAIERQRITEALARAGRNRTMAAKSLGLSRQSLHSKLKKYRLENQ
jgi:PAS domain-containing protein/ActR/RegA family two-component response regulator